MILVAKLQKSRDIKLSRLTYLYVIALRFYFFNDIVSFKRPHSTNHVVSLPMLLWHFWLSDTLPQENNANFHLQHSDDPLH